MPHRPLPRRGLPLLDSCRSERRCQVARSDGTVSRMDDVLDYCAGCVRECGCSRVDPFTAPQMLHWDGGGGIVAYYECEYGPRVEMLVGFATLA